MTIEEFRQQLIPVIADLNDADDDFAERRYLIAANLAWINQQCVFLRDLPAQRQIADMSELAIAQLSQLDTMTGFPTGKFRRHVSTLIRSAHLLRAEHTAAV